MSIVGLGFIIEVVSSRSGVWCADIICICIIDYTSPRPAGEDSVHVELHHEECTTSEVRVCDRKGCEQISPDSLDYGVTRQI